MPFLGASLVRDSVVRVCWGRLLCVDFDGVLCDHRMHASSSSISKLDAGPLTIRAVHFRMYSLVDVAGVDWERPVHCDAAFGFSARVIRVSAHVVYCGRSLSRPLSALPLTFSSILMSQSSLSCCPRRTQPCLSASLQASGTGFVISPPFPRPEVRRLLLSRFRGTDPPLCRFSVSSADGSLWTESKSGYIVESEPVPIR